MIIRKYGLTKKVKIGKKFPNFFVAFEVSGFRNTAHLSSIKVKRRNLFLRADLKFR